MSTTLWNEPAPSGRRFATVNNKEILLAEEAEHIYIQPRFYTRFGLIGSQRPWARITIRARVAIQSKIIAYQWKWVTFCFLSDGQIWNVIGNYFIRKLFRLRVSSNAEIRKVYFVNVYAKTSLIFMRNWSLRKQGGPEKKESQQVGNQPDGKILGNIDRILFKVVLSQNNFI